jgi:hypothetical protein
MKPLLTNFFFLSLFLIGCNENSESPSEINQRDSLVSSDDIYNFMNHLIEEDILKSGFRIEMKPEEDFGFHQKVDSILYQLEIKDHTTKKSEHKNDILVDSISLQTVFDTQKIDVDLISYVSISSTSFPEVLTSEDSKFIKSQINKNRDFKWNNNRLGFLEKSSHWYQISVPCFSLDKKYVIILIRSLCPGFCGGGDLYLFTKKGEEWGLQRLGAWYH